ncbi:uncharacterized protein PAF06_000069 [Gastrophryne carolinensis]
MTMTPQQKTPSKDLGLWIQEGGKKMRATVQRRRSASVISRALSKSKSHSREISLLPSHCGNGLLLGAFCSPNNMLIMKERVQLSSGWHIQERHLFLFCDSLVIAKSKSSSSMKLKKQIRLSDVWISTNLTDVSEKKHSADDSFVIGWPTTNYVVTFSSSDTKEKWLTTLSWHINEVKKNEYPKKLPVYVLYLDADEYMSSTTVMVSNMDTAEKVIKVASAQLGIPGRAADYHLWVMSGNDEPPYPLFGHEHPYSIAMNHLRDSADTPQGSNNNLSLEQSTEELLEQLSCQRQCQFIIKFKPQIPLDIRRESMQKQRRRKKSLIDWALRRSGSTTLSTSSSQSPLTPRKLFGHSLSSICPNGNLPKPIMDMLLLLYEEGPSTRGIFRRSANVKTCKELKEKLLSGDEVQIDGESVFVAAAVIMDFLRNIPDSVLSSDMYGLWMEVTEIDEPDYKIKVIKSLLDQLPEANFVLLQHLFTVLNHIEKNSEENQMTAFNLALCIAPNMLWLPTVNDPEEETKSTRKVAVLVQYLIENYDLIFDQDAVCLFTKHIQHDSGSTDDLSGIHMIHGQDSSDELEYTTSGSDPNLLKDEDAMLDESLLLEEREDWDLFSEIAACYQSKTKIDILERFSTNPMNCIESACSLSPSRDRCASEPSVCHSSRPPVQNHEPVTRQSSCDATIIHSQIDYINQLKKLQIETQKLLNEDLAPSGKSSQYAFLRSTQTRASIKKKIPRILNPSVRSSFSSLSSTTTSPSASSLSSLDSSFSYCSESSVFSPNEVSSLPFMFGTSARLNTLSPEITRKKLREWHIPLSTLFGSSACNLDAWEMQWESKDDSSVKDGGILNSEVPHISNSKECLDKKTIQHFSYSAQGNECAISLQEPKLEVNHSRAKSVSENVHCFQETSVKHIEIKRPELGSNEGLQKSRVTFFMSPNIIPTINQNEQNVNEDSCSLSSQVPQLKIPQTMFFGQNAPLVLHSVSRKQNAEEGEPQWRTQLKHVVKREMTNESVTDHSDTPSVPLDKEVTKKEQNDVVHPAEEFNRETNLSKSHTKSITSFSQTIRIRLPSSVKSTVMEYFKHSDSKSSSSSDATLQNDIAQDRTE